MFLKIENIEPRLLCGHTIQMSFVNNKTFELWNNFMPKLKTIKNRIGTELYSMEVFHEGFFHSFDPNVEFEKWATVLIDSHDELPESMSTITVSGKYAVFIHKGNNAAAVHTYNYIFREWLPASSYIVDERPHFAIMGNKYIKDSDDSEEEVWIPIKPKP